MGWLRPVAFLVVATTVGIPTAMGRELPSHPLEQITLAELAQLCPATEPIVAEDAPFAEWIDWWLRDGFCLGVQAGTVSFAFSPQYDVRLTGFPEEDSDSGYCGWYFLGTHELGHGGTAFGAEFRRFAAKHPDLGGEPAIATLLHAASQMYPCNGNNHGVYQLDLDEFRVLCTGERTQYPLLRSAPAMFEIAAIFASYSYCQGALYAWVQSANEVDQGEQIQEGASYCFPQGYSLADLQLEVAQRLIARQASNSLDVPISASLNEILEDILPCS